MYEIEITVSVYGILVNIAAKIDDDDLDDL